MKAKVLDIQSLSLSKFVVFKKDVAEYKNNKKTGVVTRHTKMGMLTPEGTGYHRYLGFNQFSARKSALPSADRGWKNVFDPENAEWVTNGVFDPTASVFKKPELSIFDKLEPGDKVWKTIDNSNVMYVVVVSGPKVSVYGRSHDIILDDNIKDIDTFVDLVKDYETLDIWIGKSPFNETTEYSGGSGKRFDGNSILVRIGTLHEFRYAFIGDRVFEFATHEPIKTFVSSVGNSGVPYPYAESDHWCYDMIEGSRSRVELHPDRLKKGEIYTDEVNDSANLDSFNVIQEGRESYKRTQVSPIKKTRIFTLEQLKTAK